MPQELQALSNVFLIPLNILVVVGTALDSFEMPTRQKLCVCVQWLLFAVILQAVYIAKNPLGKPVKKPKAKVSSKTSGKTPDAKRKRKTKRTKTPASKRKRTPSKKVQELRALI